MTAAGLMLKYNEDFYVKNSGVLHRVSACSEIKIFIVSIELQVIFIVTLKIINKPVSLSQHSAVILTYLLCNNNTDPTSLNQCKQMTEMKGETQCIFRISLFKYPI